VVVVVPCRVVPGGGVFAVDGCVTGPVRVVVCELAPPPSPERINRTAIVTATRNNTGAT
jgi:hypothetical protein